MEPLPSSQTGRSAHRGSCSGGGWVVGAEGPLRVDGRPEFAPRPSLSAPVPFLMLAEAESLEIAPRAFRARLIDRFAIDDEQALTARGFRVQNISDRTTLSSTFNDGTAHTAAVASHLNTAFWKLTIPAGTHAVLLAKTFDRFHGRQRARVLINGQHAGWWYDPFEDRTHRWGVSEFMVPSALCSEGEHEIAVDPVAGSPLWSVSAIEVLAVERT